MNYVLEKGGGVLLSLCALISPDSSESGAKTLLSSALHLPLHHDHFLFTARSLRAYWCLLDSASFFFLFSQILFFALVCCKVVHDDEFAPVVFLLITCCYCGEDKQGREERHKQ